MRQFQLLVYHHIFLENSQKNFFLCLASCAFRRDASERVADGIMSQTTVNFYEAEKFCIKKKKGRSCSRYSPSPIRFSLMSEFKKISPALPFDLLIGSLKNLGNNLVRTGSLTIWNRHDLFGHLKLGYGKTIDVFRVWGLCISSFWVFIVRNRKRCNLVI